MFVKITEVTFVNGKPAKAGDFLEVTDQAAHHLLNADRAELVDAETYAKALAKKEAKDAK